MKKKIANFVPSGNGTRIDWFRYTVPYDTGIRFALPDCHITNTNPNTKRGILGYTKQIITDEGYRIAWSPERQDMGILVDISGSAINTPDWSHYTIPPDLLFHHIAEYGGRLTRIDYAVDLIDTQYSPMYFSEQISAGAIQFRGKEWTHIERNIGKRGAWRPDGNTVYLGSRTSERFLRCYDKAAQSKIMGTSWTRIELEIKGKRAQEVGERSLGAKAGAYKGILARNLMSYIKSAKNTENQLISFLYGIVKDVTAFARGRRAENQDEFFDRTIIPYLRKNMATLSEDRIEKLERMIAYEKLIRNTDM